VTYDISLAPPRLQHMPPAALALAILLHVLIGVAVWWIAPLRPPEPEEPPIMVMFDSTPSNVGLQTPDKAGPPAESTAASPQPSTEPQREERQQQALAPPVPSAAPEPPQPAPPSDAKPEPEQVPTLPIFEFSVPPVPEPLPAPSSRDFVKPPVSRPPPRPVQRTQPLSPRPAPPAPQRPPADMPATMPSPMPGPDPGDVLIGQGRQRNDYLSRVARQIAQYRVYPTSALANNQGGRVVMRVTVARSGQVLDVGIRTSSGWPAIDAAEVETIRRAGSFPPLPSEMPGDPVVLVLPVTYSPASSRGR
jgi:protein TonB